MQRRPVDGLLILGKIFLKLLLNMIWCYQLNLNIPHDPSVLSLAIYQRENICTFAQKNRYKNVHISIIFNSAKEGNTEMYIHSTINT